MDAKDKERSNGEYQIEGNIIVFLNLDTFDKSNKSLTYRILSWR